jgi:hypothetical protein
MLVLMSIVIISTVSFYEPRYPAPDDYQLCELIISITAFDLEQLTCLFYNTTLTLVLTLLCRELPILKYRSFYRTDRKETNGFV